MLILFIRHICNYFLGTGLVPVKTGDDRMDSPGNYILPNN